MKPLVLFILLFATAYLKAQKTELFPTYNSIGIKISEIGNYDSCQIEYKKQSESEWLLGFQPDTITISNEKQFRGSIMLLEANTSYEIKITLFNNSNSKELEVLNQKTWALTTFTPTSDIKWVSPNGNGDYTKENPGNLKNLFTSGKVICGTTIYLTDGTYSTNDLQLNINNSCTENTPIVIIAAPNSKPIFDGGMVITTKWVQTQTDSNLYYTTIPSNARHSNICVLGSTSIYPYPSLNAEILLGNYNLRNLSFGYDGFVRDENTIWIKTHKGINPNDSIVTVSNSFRFLTVYGKNNNAYLKIKGIKFKNFGKPVLNELGNTNDAYLAMVFDLRNVHHVYFDSCYFINNTSDIAFNSQCNYLTIQNSYFKNEVGKWTHAMIKKANIFVHTILHTISSSRGRGIETSAIFLNSSKQVVIKNNYFDGLNSGLESYISYGFNEEIDINNNVFVDNFDAIECDGYWSNLRVWGNEIIRPMAGISAAPPYYGPRYFYKNLIHGMQGRRNEKDDPYFIGCQPVNNVYNGQGVGIKTNSTYMENVPEGNLYFFNNTFHSDDTLGFVFTSWYAEWRKALFINNSYSHSKSFPFFYCNLASVQTNSDFQISSINENYFSYNPNSPIIVAKHINGQYNCTEIDKVDDIQSTLSSISGSPYIFIGKATQLNPMFKDKKTGGFELEYNSPLIDAGIEIKGFYDFNGKSPDIGAKESKFTNKIIEIINNNNTIIAFPNPAKNYVKINKPNFEKPILLTLSNNIGKIIYQSKSFNPKTEIIDLSILHNGIYFIEVTHNCKKYRTKIIKIAD